MNIENRDGTETMPPFVVKDKEARYVQLPTDTLRILKEYQKEAPEGVPYILFTRQRFNNVMAKWRKCRSEGGTWNPRWMMNHVRREFLIHVKRAEIKPNGSFTVHTLRKCCAQNWADYLPANVVKFYMGHSSIETTNRYYSIVDESHLLRTREAMDKMLKPDDDDSKKEDS
jgi:integrase